MKKKGFFSRIKELFGIGVEKEAFFEELEDLLIEGDLGVNVAMSISTELRRLSKENKIKSKEDLSEGLKKILLEKIRSATLEPTPTGLNLFLVLGVNGVGKTTSISKMARYFQDGGRKDLVLCAGDTFRAAAIEQLKIQGQRLGVRVVSQDHGADPGAVLFDALDSAKAKGENIVLADTAGRMHNKENLVRELQKIDKIARSKLEGGQYRKILVVDSTTGQNALKQAEVFHEAIGLDGLILSKYDSSGKGGIAVTISSLLGLPFYFVGVGETLKDLRPFNKEEFINGLLADDKV